MTAPALPSTLRRVLASDTCAGCGLCAGLDPAIGLQRDTHGWWRPVPRGAARQETDALLAKTCPGARLSPWEGGDPDRAIDTLWGPWKRVMTANAADPEVRHLASSGGALSALAIHLLQTRRVDRVLHVSMEPGSPLLTAIHRSFDRADVLVGAGSRYAPAAPLAEIGAELERGGRILFIGKPCDAGAVRELTRADPVAAERIPYILSFFCAGTPSQRGTDRILDRLGVAKDEVEHFRYRGDGWPGYATATRRDGSTERISYEKSWGGILSKEVQFRCKICADGIGGAADVAAADAWYGGETGYPSFDEADGRSLMISRTTRGEELVREAEAAGVIRTEPLALGEIPKMQPSQARRRELVASRMMAMRLALRTPPETDGLLVAEASRRAGLFDNLKSLAGTFRRIIQPRKIP